MAYTCRNRLQRIIDIQSITLEHTVKGVTQEHVYNTLIYPIYRISRRTYYNYLSSNAKADLKKLESNKAKQMALFN